MSSRERTSRASAALAVALVVVLALALTPEPALAHTDLESSDPSDGSVIDEPLEVVTLVFTTAVTPTGEEFQLLTPDGTVRIPAEASSADGATWTLRFDPPVTGGEVGLRWTIQAGDSHAISGAFSFTTPAAEPPPTTAPPATTLPEASGGAPDAAPESSSTAVGVEDTVAGVAVTRPAYEQAVPVDEPAADPAPAVSLDDFLQVEAPAAGAERLGALGRFLSVAGLLVGAGGAAFAALVVRHHRQDLEQVLQWVEGGGVLVVVGAAVSFGAQVVVEEAGEWSAMWSGSAVGDVATSTAGTATGLRVVGGLALMAGARWARAQSSATGTLARRALAVVGVGAAGVVVAHLFDGHTVTEGNRLVTALADLVHVGAAAVWGGGVLMLALVTRRHRRNDVAGRTREVATRFSVVATVALGATGAAGVALTAIVVSSPSDLWSTEWGRTLLVKVGLVLLVLSAGAYNHRVLVPQLAASPDSPATAARFRTVITWEAVGFVAVVVATALLMGAAT